MEISDLMSFDGNFAPEVNGKPQKIDDAVKKGFATGAITSVHMKDEDKKRGLKTDPKLWKLLNGLFGASDYEVTLASTPNGGYAEVYDKITGNNQVCYIKEIQQSLAKGLAISACEFTPIGASQPYSSGHKGTVLLAAFIALRLGLDTELMQRIDTYKNWVVEEPDSSLFDDPSIAANLAATLCEITTTLYYTLKHEYNLPTRVNQLRQNEVEDISKTIRKIAYGTPRQIKIATESKEGKRGMFDLNPARKLTPEEEALVPTIPSSFKWEEWHFTLAQEIRDSQEFSEPTNVIMLYGDSGSGKSQAAGAIANLLNRPRLIWTADPDTDEFKLIGSTMPNTSPKRKKTDLSKLCKEQGLPTFEDVVFDYENTFRKLFGKEPTQYDEPVDCYKAIAERVEYPADDSEFVFVESPIVKALRNGWIVEVQEISIIKRQAVVVALNSLLDYTNALTLPTGETIQRHKEAVVIMTANLNYEGCRLLQQSVLSRINEMREVATPDADVLFERAKANTGFRDRKALKKMAELVASISEFSKAEDISDGVCGSRELQNWCKKAMLFQKRQNGQDDAIDNEVLCGAAFPTIISHCSQNDEDRERIITGCIGKIFTPQEIEAGRNFYNLGYV